jgi:hypothetical protein
MIKKEKLKFVANARKKTPRPWALDANVSGYSQALDKVKLDNRRKACDADRLLPSLQDSRLSYTGPAQRGDHSQRARAKRFDINLRPERATKSK